MEISILEDKTFQINDEIKNLEVKIEKGRETDKIEADEVMALELEIKGLAKKFRKLEHSILNEARY